MQITRREMMAATAGMLGAIPTATAIAAEPDEQHPPRAERAFKIVDLKITPIALPDPPILAAGGCHGPYFLRNVVEVVTDAGITGIGETRGGENETKALERAREHVVGKSRGPRGIWIQGRSSRPGERKRSATEGFGR